MAVEEAAAAGRWAVVNTQPHRETVAVENLDRQGFTVYCPWVRRSVSHARRLQMVLRPLFPGYVFVLVDPERQRWRPILSTIGVRTLVHFGDRPAQLEAGFIAALREREENGVIARPLPVRRRQPLEVGEAVRLVSGPFAGLVATILSLDERERLTVLMDVLRRGVKTRVHADQVEATAPVVGSPMRPARAR